MVQASYIVMTNPQPSQIWEGPQRRGHFCNQCLGSTIKVNNDENNIIVSENMNVCDNGIVGSQIHMAVLTSIRTVSTFSVIPTRAPCRKAGWQRAPRSFSIMSVGSVDLTMSESWGLTHNFIGEITGNIRSLYHVIQGTWVTIIILGVTRMCITPV